MKFIFWQNIVSPHQSYFLKELSKKYSVVLVVERLMDDDRKSQGWEIPDLGSTEIIVINDILSISYLLEKNEKNHHFFSGINSYPIISRVFKTLIKIQKVNLIAESPIQMGIKTEIRYLKYRYLAFKYAKKIDHIFAMGNLGVDWYVKTGFRQKSIHRFQYTIKLPDEEALSLTNRPLDQNTFSFTFIGQLISRKGIDTLIEVFSKLKNNNWELNIIGDGILKNKISDAIENFDLTAKVSLLGVKSNRDAMQFLTQNTDFLILPSRFDGWGAVVNEALARGVKVITNNKCGASCMIKNGQFGSIYRENDPNQLISILDTILGKKNDNSFEKKLELARLYQIENQEKLIENFISKFTII